LEAGWTEELGLVESDMREGIAGSRSHVEDRGKLIVGPFQAPETFKTLQTPPKLAECSLIAGELKGSEENFVEGGKSTHGDLEGRGTRRPGRTRGGKESAKKKSPGENLLVKNFLTSGCKEKERKKSENRLGKGGRRTRRGVATGEGKTSQRGADREP